ncbi:MAG: trypsin-like peptidase domain-containing protein [Alphaproteobacteria bacterium]|nr:trypsin-like peptidase domain-containing protein [Alphaproteobacteria bacterium]
MRVRVAVETPFIGDGRGASTGSGFLVDLQRGWIVTNAHVAKRSPARVEIAFKDRPFVAGRRHYVDPHLDLAIVEIDSGAVPKEARTAELGCEDPLPPGRSVGAFGHPWGLNFTATRGILSGVRFRFGFEFVQTDAALNPGNSGGPLIDLASGRVLGVNAATMSRQTSEGLNFAVPVAHVCRLLALLAAGRDPSPPEIPLLFASDDTNEEALIVARAKPGPWAELFRPGDRIVAVNGDRDITNLTRLLNRLRGGPDSVRFELERDGASVVVETAVARQPQVTDRTGVRVSGLIVAPSGEPDAFEINPENLLVIHSVDQSSTAALAGIQAGDLIHSINGRSFSDPGDFYRWLEGQPRDGRLTLVLRRTARARHLFYEYHTKSIPLTPPRIVR